MTGFASKFITLTVMSVLGEVPSGSTFYASKTHAMARAILPVGLLK